MVTLYTPKPNIPKSEIQGAKVGQQVIVAMTELDSQISHERLQKLVVENQQGGVRITNV